MAIDTTDTTTWMEIREPHTNRLLFKFDPERLLIQSICNFWDGEKRQRVRFPVITDLTQYRHPSLPVDPAPSDDAA